MVVVERLAQVKEEEEKQRLEDMSEDEYDALTEEEKARVDKRRLASKKERLRKYVQARPCWICAGSYVLAQFVPT